MLKVVSLLFCVTLTMFAIGQSDQEVFQKASECYKKEQYKEALKILNKKSSTTNWSDESYALKANCLYKLGKSKETYDLVDERIRSGSKYYEFFYLRSEIFLLVKKPFEAMEDINMAIKHAKSDSLLNLAYTLRASVKISTMNYNGAMDDCSIVLKKDSLNKAALTNLSLCYGEIKEHDKAIQILKKILSIDSLYSFALLNIGYEYNLIGKYDEALSHLNFALKKYPKDGYALSNRSYSFLGLGKIDLAKKDINESIKVNPNNSYAYRNLGLIMLADGNNAKACEAFKNAQLKGFSESYGNEVNELISKNCN